MTTFAEARQFLLDHREDYAGAYAAFRWPEPAPFNWAIDWFDQLGTAPESRDRVALWIVEIASGAETRITFAICRAARARRRTGSRSLGVKRGDRVLLPLGNVGPLWEVMLASIKLGAVVIPATTLLPEADLADRIRRGNVKVVVTAATRSANSAPPTSGSGSLSARRAEARLATLRSVRCLAGPSRPTGDRAGRPAAALFHLRDDRAAEARASLPPELSRRPPLHDVLDRAPARRRPPEHLLAGLGEARLELVLRSVERRRHRSSSSTSRASRRNRCSTPW